ncbi:quinolinate synthase NadA [uncultured Ruminococcus sp.]|uniref:quinolinate synthase NadA n=1 Tax=uncultured Ruminococcus sp. TaxID=165186 RepID=UPI0025EA3AE1|nr:quinolinate synthase NadA [uncultured Ruminococcus sp.]
MNIAQLQQKINELKKEKDVCILAHSYQAHEILEIADFTGDSYKLSVDASKVENKNILMCGVRFMAETCKILSPEKTVYLAQPTAGCSMADQMDRQLISQVKEMYPDYAVVAYINTTADLKTICDVCVTSSSAVKIVNNMPEKDILFIPDCNLGYYVAKQCPDKNIKLLNGGCPIHACVNTDDVKKAKAMYPNAEFLVHPECTPEVVAMADYVGSTSGIMNYAVNSDKTDFIIGTEISIAEHLQYMCPDKNFYILTQKLICPNMKATTLVDVYNCLAGKGGEEITLDDKTITDAKKCIDEMIRLG